MRKKRRIVAFLLMMLMVSSSTQVFASNQTSTGKLLTKTSKNSIISPLQLKSVDGQVVHIPNIGKVQKLNKVTNYQVKSVAQTDFDQTKAVAEEKASVLIDDYGCTSVQYALIDNGKIILSGNAGVYSKEDNKAVTADNMYGTGSISKMFVTTAVMKLVDEGKVKLDAPVTQYIREFKMTDSRYKKITVRMLLNHSSGLMGTCYTNVFLLGDNDTYAHDTFLKQLSTQRLKADPGEYSVYCNDGFTLAEILVEHVTGVSYTNYLAKNITNPLKMNNTKTPISKFDRDKLVKTYTDGISCALPAENANMFGAGGVYSSAEDLCTFATTFTQNSNKILSNKSLKAMENKEYLKGIWPEDRDSTFGYGLGWDSVNLYPFNQYNIKALTKGGDIQVYHSSLIVLPEQNMAMAVLSSGGASPYDQVMAQVVLLTALKEKGVIKDIIPDKTFTAPQQAAVPSEMKNYEGLYASPSGFKDMKIDEAGILSMSYPQTPEKSTETYVYTKDGTFVSSNGSQGVKFVKESNGKTYLHEFGYENFPSLGQTAFNDYTAQKEDANKLPDSVSKAWAERDGKKYYILNEKYSSVYYMFPCPYEQVNFAKGVEGYWDRYKVVDKNTAVDILDGPVMMSRDLRDCKFYKKDNFEYLSSGGNVFVEEASMKNLPTENKFLSIINIDGYAKWYKIGDESADKEITVDVPRNAGFVVFDSNDNLVNNSLITGIKNVKLPKNGTIVFMGNPLARFKIQYK